MNVDLNKYKYSGYYIGFDSHSDFFFFFFFFSDGSFGKNIIIFGAVMSSSAHIDKLHYITTRSY